MPPRDAHRKPTSGIAEYFKHLESERRRCDAAADEKRRKIDAGELLDVDREAARSGVDLTDLNPDEIVSALKDLQEARRAADPYLGDTIENLTDASLKPWQTYGAGHRSPSRRAKQTRRRRGRPFDTKEVEPREHVASVRMTTTTHRELASYKAESDNNASDVLADFANLRIAARNGNRDALYALHVLSVYGPRSRSARLDPGLRKAVIGNAKRDAQGAAVNVAAVE